MRTSHATRILTQQEFFWIHSFFINHVTMSRAITGIMWGVSGRACHGEHVGNGARGAVPPDYFPPGPVHVCSEWRNSTPVVPTVVDSGTSLMKDNERVWSFRIAHQQYQCTVCQGSRVQPRQVRGEFFEAAWWLEISRNWWLLYWRWMPGWSSLEHFLLQYPMVGFQPVAKQETRMTTSYYKIVRVQRFFLVQSPSFGIQVMKVSRKAGNESVQKETVRCSVSLLVYGKHRANLLPTGKLQRKWLTWRFAFIWIGQWRTATIG